MEAHFRKKSQPQFDLVFEGRGLGKKYKKNGFHLKGVDIDLRPGEITGVGAEDGNGKTTLFRIVAGDLLKSEGTLRFTHLSKKGKEKFNWAEAKKMLAYVPQELPQWYGSLKNNLHLEATLHDIKGKANEDAVEYIIHRLGLPEHAEKSWNELSGGYKLRFALAKALVWKPRLLVIDEPLANLDINAQSIVLNDLKYLAKSLRFPLSILISSQHLHEIESVADKIMFLKAGEVVYYGNIKDFGKERNENSFELECSYTLSEMEEILKGLDYNSLEHNGLRFIIHTPLEISQQELLQVLLDKQIEIGYFRNISQSTKKLFV